MPGPLDTLAQALGTSDGISFQTKRALMENGLLVPTPAPTVEQVTEPVVGGPSPSSELLERVRQQQELRAQQSLQAIMEKRRRALQPPLEDRPLTGGNFR